MHTSSLSLTLAASALLSFGTAKGSIIMDWDASSWSGSGAWTDGVSGEQLTIGAGAPTKGVDTTSFAGSGKSITYTSYNGASGFVSDASSLLAGLKEFTVSAVIRVGSTPGAGAGPITNGWTYNAVSAFELPGGNQGEFQFGFDSGNTLNGAVGLNGDHFVAGGSVSANQWATVAFILDQDPNHTSNLSEYGLSTYINGVQQGLTAVFTYGGSPGDAIRNSPFGVGYNVVVSADRRYLTGDIAQVRFDNTALSAAQLTADAANYLGTLEVPEPAAGTLALLGLSLGLTRRNRR